MPREPSSARRASMKRREENLHKMLAISDTLAIRQAGATLDIVTAVESRRVVAGSHTQVSLPEGELVVFSAHGVAPSVHSNAAARGLKTIDATCPLVTKVHLQAQLSQNPRDCILGARCEHQ